MSGGSALGPPESRRLLGRVARRTWVVVAVGLLLAVGSFSLGWYIGRPTLEPEASPPAPTPAPWVSYEFISEGNLTLHLPLMTAYTPDNRSFPGVHGKTTMMFVGGATDTSVAFDWAEMTGPNLPVRFVWRDAAIHGVNESLGRFVITPNNCINCGLESSGWVLEESNWSVVMVVDVEMSYSVFRAALVPSVTNGSWLEVDYSLLGVQRTGLRLPSPYAEAIYNASFPRPSDLAPVGGPFPMTLLPSSQEAFDVFSLLPPSAVYHNPLPAVAFDAGRFGSIHARLISAFSWAEPNEYRMRMDGGGEAPVTLQMYVDMRFGSLYPVLLP